MRQVIVFPRGQLTQADRDALTDADIVAIEADDPKSVVTILPGAPLASTDDLFMAALNAITNGSASMGVAYDFAKALHKRLAARDMAKG